MSFGFEEPLDYLKEGLGELTEQGVAQMHELGRVTRESLVSRGLDKPKVSISSSLRNRTMDSAIQFMRGFKGEELMDPRPLSEEEQLLTLAKEESFFMLKPDENYIFSAF